MKNRYLIIDAEYGGTGIRDQYDGFISLDDIPISDELKVQVSNWVKRYPSLGNTRSFDGISSHDKIGIGIMKKVREELGSDYKVRYYSDIRGKELVKIEGERIVEI